MRLRPSERQAISALERVINDAKIEGFFGALALVEEQVYSVADLDELLLWLRAANEVAREEAKR